MNLISKVTLSSALCLGVVMPNPLQAQPIPALAEVNQALPESPRIDLDRRYKQLASTRTALRARIDYYNSRCHIIDNQADAKACPIEKDLLNADKDAYIVAVGSFNWDLEQAVGEYRIGLERLIRESDDALNRDAVAMNRLGFSHRAEDFERWADVSTEANRLAVEKIEELIFEAGADKLREGFIEQLSHANGNEIDQILLKLRIAGLSAEAVRESLNRYQETKNVELLRPIALQLTSELKSTLKFDLAVQKGEKAQAAWEALSYFAPPGMQDVMKAGEAAAWATMAVGTQVVSLNEIARLNVLTITDLKTLQSIHCLVERHLEQRYQAKAKLSDLTGRGRSELVNPIRSRSCSTR